MSEIAQLADVPQISFIENLTLAEVDQKTRELYSRNYRKITGKDPVLSDADPVALVLKSMALMNYQIMQYIDNSAKQQLLKTSWGEGLDNLAALHGLKRKGAEKARTLLRFKLANVQQPGAVGIPAGTRAKTQDSIYFATLDYAEIAPGAEDVDVEAEALEAGANATDIGVGEIRLLVDPIPYIAGVENVTVSSGGTDIESDEALTERTYLAPSAYSCAGPANAYEYFAKAWRNDVKDVEIVNPAPCEVEVYFTLTDGLPSEADCAGMEGYLREDARRPMCDEVHCRAPEEVEYDIQMEYTIARSRAKVAVTIQNDVAEAVMEYAAWQRTMGRDIDPAELVARVKNAGAKRVKVIAPADRIVGNTQVPRLRNCDTESFYRGLEND